MSYLSTVEVIHNILNDKKLRYKTEIDGKEKIAYYNQNGGISTGKDTLVLGGKMLNARWELLYKECTFLEAINSGKEIKYSGDKEFKSIQETLYDLLDNPIGAVVERINGKWFVKE